MTTAAKGRDQEDQRSVTSVCTDEVPLVTTRKVDVQHSKIRRLFWNRETKAALLLIVSMGLITWLVPKWNVRTHTYNLPPEIVKGEYKCDYWGRDDDQFDRVDLETMKDRYERGALVLLKGICVANKRQFTVPLSTSSSAVYWIEEEINGSNNEEEEEAARLKKQAEDLRDQIRKLEDNLDRKPGKEYQAVATTMPEEEEEEQEMSLKKRRILVVGANGRLGSMVCRHLLRNNPQTEVVACVHYVGEDSPTSRGYARLSYEVGAEDGVGTIGAAWSGQEERVATFEYADYMKDYNLQNLRLVECELLDPVQCQTICEGVDSVVWCATDFNGNQPRAVSGLNFAFLFRAVAAPTKGRVEVEGLRNMLGALKLAKQDRNDAAAQAWGSKGGAGKAPISFVHVSAAPNSLADFETPFGSFHGQKREGEAMVSTEFPSLSHTILQMSTFDDNFVEEGKDIEMEQVGIKQAAEEGEENEERVIKRQRINRRDAARAVVDALTNEEMEGKMFQLWTDLKVLK
ncbi:MAG: hypothetical protein SGBAC_004606 [Bacillariaceae sp.]